MDITNNHCVSINGKRMIDKQKVTNKTWWIMDNHKSIGSNFVLLINCVTNKISWFSLCVNWF